MPREQLETPLGVASSHAKGAGAGLLAPRVQARMERAAAELHVATERAALLKMRDASIAKFKRKFGVA